jgi:hypothetical protein
MLAPTSTAGWPATPTERTSYQTQTQNWSYVKVVSTPKKPHFEKCAQDYGALSLISWIGCACAVVAAGAVVSRESCLRGPIRGFRLLRL